MLVPESSVVSSVSSDPLKGHVISMYLATAGAGGSLLGADEKEIIYLVFGIIDLQNNEIIGVKQYLVRPLGGAFVKAASSPNTSATSSETGSVASASFTEPLIPEAVLQSAGRLLNDVISDFDTYLRSLLIDPNSPSVCLVTDGQLPLRQCLHPESGAKEVHLPSYYWKFCDLKKEYVRSKPGDLSRALIPIADATKLPNMPVLPASPSTIADILSEMELQPYEDNDLYIKESRDMITIVQSLIIAGHTFDTNEIVSLTLEPGICSIDDEIDGNCIVRARGLPWQSSDQDIARFFRGLNVAKGGVALCLSPQGRRNGEALIRFISQEHRDMALKRHKHHIGSRYIEVYRASGEDFLAVAGGASNEAQSFLSKGAQVIIRMRGLPYDCTANQVLEFFANGDNSCDVLDDIEGILFVKKPDGRSTGDAFVLFAQESDAPKALSKHRESIGQRYIELFRSTIAEVQQVLNRSMDPKTYEQNTPKPPLISQIPPAITQMPMLPQHVITSGTEKNCIRLRGLPYEAKVEHILHFLEDFAKHIVYQGVHLVYNAQGQFNGEAFIQMDSETAALASAQQKHHKHMMFGKKQRYIEVFQCSGEDMNMVLNGGGYQSPPISKASGNTMLTPNFPSFSQYGPPTSPILAPASPRAHHSPIYQQPPQILYWGYPNQPMSPTTAYFGPLQIPPHAFTHFSPNLGDRPALLTVGNVEQTPPNSTVPATTALPNQHRVATNFNSQIDDQGNMSRVDVSNTLCYHTQNAIPQFLHETLTQKLNAIQQKSHLHMSQHSPINDHSHHPQILDNSPPTITIPPPNIMQHQQVMSKHYPHISLNHYQRMMQPLNINTQQNTYHQQFYHQINWNQQLTHYQHQ